MFGFFKKKKSAIRYSFDFRRRDENTSSVEIGIHCHDCDRTSYHPVDIAQLYLHCCHRFMPCGDISSLLKLLKENHLERISNQILEELIRQIPKDKR